MPETLSFADLQLLVHSEAAVRYRVTLQPAGVAGTKVFPPTFAGAVGAMEERRVPGYDDPVDCVLLKSVQSQASALEKFMALGRVYRF